MCGVGLSDNRVIANGGVRDSGAHSWRCAAQRGDPGFEDDYGLLPPLPHFS